MSRDIDPDLKDEFDKEALRPVFLMEFQYISGTLRFWTGLGEIDVGGDTYTGSGHVINVSEVTETQAIEANGLAFMLSGVDEELVSIALQEEYQGRACSLSLSCLDEAGLTIGTPLQIFAGYMDVMEISDSGTGAVITQTAEHKLSVLNKAKVRRYTPEDQKSRYAGDKFMDFIPSMQDKEVIWGRKTATE